MNKTFVTILLDTISVLFISLFIYTAVSKAIDYRNFYATMDVMPGFNGAAYILAPSVIVSEIIIATILMVPAGKLPGLWLSLGLMCLFTFYLLFTIYQGYALPCSCGGVLQRMTWRQHVFFNLSFILLAITGIVFYTMQNIYCNKSGTTGGVRSPRGNAETPYNQ